MTLSELYQALSYGELANLSIANDGSGVIKDTYKPALLNYVNEGLLRLYSRYVLKEANILLQMDDNTTTYQLLPRFSVNYTPTGSSDNEPLRYILDQPSAKFPGDVLRVLSLYDSQGAAVPLNDESQVYSVFTPQANTLQVPFPAHVQRLSVSYQARHAKLLGDPDEIISLPDVLFAALTSYVAYKVFSHMNSQDSSAKSREYLAAYEAICADVVDKDLVNSSTSTTNTRFFMRGWI